MPPIRETPEYALITAFYGDRRARRSQVRYLVHIDQGLTVLTAIGASEAAHRAYALHPLVQGDEDLAANFDALTRAAPTLHPHALGLAMEYRSVANAFLSPMEDHPGYDDPARIRLSPLPEVNQMLVADKVQNYQDFLHYHRDTHPRAAALDRYFRAWLARLEISDAQFATLCPAPPEHLG